MANNLVIAEVFADAINEGLSTNLKAGSLAFDATSLVPDIKQFGDTVHFPKFTQGAMAKEVTKGTAIVPENVDMTDLEAKIRQVAKAVRIFDAEAAQIKASSIQNSYVKNVLDAFAQKVDSDLVKSMDTDAVLKHAIAGAGAITSTEMFDAMSLFGDQQDTDSFAGILCNSKFYSSLMKMDEFVSTSRTYNQGVGLANGIVSNGVIGYWLNIPVVLSDNATFENGEAKMYFVKKNSLGYIYQKNTKVEVQRQGLLLADDLIVSGLYATKVIDTSGIVLARKTIA